MTWTTVWWVSTAVQMSAAVAWFIVLGRWLTKALRRPRRAVPMPYRTALVLPGVAFLASVGWAVAGARLGRHPAVGVFSLVAWFAIAAALTVTTVWARRMARETDRIVYETAELLAEARRERRRQGRAS